MFERETTVTGALAGEVEVKCEGFQLLRRMLSLFIGSYVSQASGALVSCATRNG